MKRLFLLVLFCMVSSFAPFEKALAGSPWEWAKYTGKRALEGTVRLVDGTCSLLSIPSLEGKLLPYASGADIKTMLDNGVDFIVSGNDLAAYQGITNNIQVNSDFFNYSPQYGQALIHHEVQHLKDAMTLKKAGYSATDLGHNIGNVTLDSKSQGGLQAILEARAYGEEVVFAYENMKLYKGDYKKAYDNLVANYDLAKAFDKAIKEGKSVEEARHQAEIDFLNSDFLKLGYLDRWIEKEKSSNLRSLSIEEVLDLLDDGKLTKEDVYAADQFWENLCSYEAAKNSKECQAYSALKKIRHKKVYCSAVEKKWQSCGRLGATLAGDKLGARLFTTQEDDALYDGCCKNK